MQNYYHLLGVSNFASFEEIAAAYKQKHNELFSSDSPLANIPKLRALKEGFEVLVDEEKREEYDEKLNAYLEDIDVKFEEAIKDISSRDLQSAIEKINWCIARNPGEADYYESLGLAYRLGGALESAVNAYWQGLSTGQRKAFFHRNLGDVYRQLHDEDNADTHYLDAAEGFKEILKVDPKNSEAMEQLADIYTLIRFYEESYELYRQLIASHPYDGDYHRGAGAALYELELYEEAEKFLLESLRLKPGDSASLLYLGLVYFKRRLLGLAVQTLRDSLKTRPNQDDVVQLIAQIESVRKEIGKTVEEITYDPAPDAYVEGFVKWYNPETGMGVLTCDEYPEVLLHYTAIKDENCVALNKGDAVKFGVVRDNLSPIAVQVEKLGEPSLSDAMPGVIEKFDADKKMGIIRSCDGKEVFFSFSALTQEATDELCVGLGVLFESKGVTGLDDKVSQQAVRIRVRKKRVLPVQE